MTESPTIPQVGPRITPDHIKSVIGASTWTDTKIGRKTTVVCLTLPNGFEVIESSGCVDPLNYDHALGVEICKKRIIDQVWKLEGYALAHDLAKAPKDDISDKARQILSSPSADSQVIGKPNASA